MTGKRDDHFLHVASRELAVPSSVSPQAQAVLATMPAIEPAVYPDPADLGAWRAFRSAGDETICSLMGPLAEQIPIRVDTDDLGGVPAYRFVPRGSDPEDGRVYLAIHGGALVMGGGEACRIMSAISAHRVGALTWAVDHRLPPDDPYPAPLDDCLAAYAALLERHSPDQIIVGGESAGGNLAAAVVLRARDEGLPLPAAVVLQTPQIDLTESGDSFQTNRGIDRMLGSSLMSANLLYAAGHDLADPYLSPIFGDLRLGFPPTLLSTGTRDLFLSNAVRMHRALRAAGVEAQLHVLEAAPHGGFFGSTPEDDELNREIREFVDSKWRRNWMKRGP